MTAALNVDDVMAMQPVIPVIVIDNADDAVPLAETLVASGLPVLEVTLRTPAALEAVRRMSGVSGAIVGAGTVLTSNDVMIAQEAGARFIVTPGLSASAVAACREASLPILAGVATATEVMTGLDLGLDRFKFFPAEQAGGIAMLKALGGPFGNVRFCPTGGISATSAPDYLKLPNVAVVGGGWVAPANLIAAKNWDEIGKLAREAAALKRG
jgi:2-dehydro-3-deoxyphosphogluconate aldolase/(4S)-4-hydroxy-2-oxoglutarate aldolase